jgi:hypothetical protein
MSHAASLGGSTLGSLNEPGWRPPHISQWQGREISEANRRLSGRESAPWRALVIGHPDLIRGSTEVRSWGALTALQ